MKLKSLFACACFAAAVIGCDGDASAPGAALVKFTANPLSDAEIEQVDVKVLDQDGNLNSTWTLRYDEEEESWSGTATDIETGTYDFELTATVSDAEDIVLRAEDQEIAEDETASVNFFYNEITEETVPVPFIDSVSASSAAPETGSDVTLSVSASSGDGELAYAWSADCGTFDEATTRETTWTAPDEEGTCTITIVVSDENDSSTSVSFGLEVSSSPSLGSAEIKFEVIPSPTAKYTVANERLLAGDETAIILTDLSPADSSVSWEVPDVNGCPGSFSADAGTESTFTLGETDGTEGTCNVHAVISHDGASTTIIFELGIAAHPTIS